MLHTANISVIFFYDFLSVRISPRNMLNLSSLPALGLCVGFSSLLSSLFFRFRKYSVLKIIKLIITPKKGIRRNGGSVHKKPQESNKCVLYHNLRPNK